MNAQTARDVHRAHADGYRWGKVQIAGSGLLVHVVDATYLARDML